MICSWKKDIWKPGSEADILSAIKKKSLLLSG